MSLFAQDFFPSLVLGPGHSLAGATLMRYSRIKVDLPNRLSIRSTASLAVWLR